MSTPLHVHTDHHPDITEEWQVVVSIDTDTALAMAREILTTYPNRDSPGTIHDLAEAIRQCQIRVYPEAAFDLGTELRDPFNAPRNFEQCRNQGCTRAALDWPRCHPHALIAQQERDEATRARLTAKDWRDFSMGGATDPLTGRTTTL